MFAVSVMATAGMLSSAAAATIWPICMVDCKTEYWV